MIATLQTELEHSKSHLDRVKQEVRNCRREIGTLTRRSEDLRETRDRMRGEIEALNNVIARKERMVAGELSTLPYTADHQRCSRALGPQKRQSPRTHPTAKTSRRA
jgi:FtsZ-binding cell division protein ZapB